MISVKTSGSSDKASRFLNSMKRGEAYSVLEKYGRMGVLALSQATPVDSGLTANAWTYEVTHQRGHYSITWHNTNIVSGIPVAILIQYGHATRSGTWVVGRDYINPVIRPLFDKIANEVWRGVTNG